MIVNKTSLDAVYGNLKTTFNGALQSAVAEATWNQIAMRVPSSGATNVYSWLESFPKMRKWVGEKQVDNLKKNEYTVVNDDFEVTVGVKRNDMEDDNVGHYSNIAAQAGQSGAELPDQLVYELVNIGFGKGKGWDQVSFFSDAHPYSDGKKTITVSNKSTKALSFATLAKARESYGAARTAMRKLKDSNGTPLNLRPNVLLVPPTLEDTARLLTTAEDLEDGTKNPYKGTATVVVSGYLESDTAWFLIDMSQKVKPLIYQERKAPVFVKHDAATSHYVFMNGEYLFGAEARGAAAYGFWQLIHGSTGADA